MVKIIESNNWLKRGIWGHIPKPHYHSTVHECYAPISGWTRVLYGVSSKDDPADGVSFEMKAGDVEVHPAGTSHCHLESSADYRYFGLYPKVRPWYRSTRVPLYQKTDVETLGRSTH